MKVHPSLRFEFYLFKIIVIFCILNQFKESQGCPFYITISLESKKWLKINWGPGCIQNTPEWIALYPKDPSVENVKHDAFIETNYNSSGSYITNIRIDNFKLPDDWNKSNIDDKISSIIKYPNGKCLNYYLGAYYRIPDTNYYDMSVNCLKIQPNWMTMTEYISRIPLKHLFIPGTHSSGAYKSGTIRSRSIVVKNFGYVQNFDVWTQLVFGIRFLDFKIGYRANLSNNYEDNSNKSSSLLSSSKSTSYLNGKNFWIVNENILINQLQPMLNDVKNFVLLSGEVVIIDFSEFPIGFSNEPKRHIEFLEFIRKEFENLMYERNEAPPGYHSYDLTISDIRSKGKNLIILYPVEELIDLSEYDFIWPSWKRFSVSNLNSDETLDLMRILFKERDTTLIQNEGWIFYGVKTLEESYNPDRDFLTTKERAKIVNTKLNSWLSGPWSQNANVVITDFFLNTNLIEIAIQVNIQKGFEFANKNLTKIEM